MRRRRLRPGAHKFQRAWDELHRVVVPALWSNPGRFELHVSAGRHRRRGDQVPEMRAGALADDPALVDREPGGRDRAHRAEPRGCHFHGAVVGRVGVEDTIDLLCALPGRHLRGTIEQSQLNGRQQKGCIRLCRRAPRRSQALRTGARLPRRDRVSRRCRRRRRWGPSCCWPAGGGRAYLRGRTS